MPADLRTPFFEAALDVLGNEGYAGLKQAKVCAALQVTTGAFYHSFGSWHDFTTQLLDYWRSGRTERLVATVSAEHDPVLRLQLLLDLALALPHRAEAGIRAWSLTDPDVAQIQHQVDEQRLQVIRTAFAEIAGPEHAEEFAQAGLAILIGFEQQEHFKPEHLQWSLRLVLQAAIAHQQ